jgi:hypothetical protein
MNRVITYAVTEQYGCFYQWDSVGDKFYTVVLQIKKEFAIDGGECYSGVFTVLLRFLVNGLEFWQRLIHT